MRMILGFVFKVTVIYHTDTSELLGTEWEEDSVQGPSHHQESPHSSTIKFHGVPQGSKCVLRHERHLSRGQERLPRGQDHEEMDEEESEKTQTCFCFFLLQPVQVYPRFHQSVDRVVEIMCVKCVFPYRCVELKRRLSKT